MNDLVNEHFKIKRGEFSADDEANITYNGHTYLIFGEPDTEFKQEQEDLRPESKDFHHINFYTMRRFIELLDDIKEPLIVESGTSATVARSSDLFDKYICSKGGDFITVDINPGAAYYFSKDITCSRTKTVTSDSVQFFKNFDKVTSKKIDAVYLDSWDVEYLNPMDSANHCKNELLSILPHLNDYCIILIDDTPKNPLYLPWRNDISKQVYTLYEITGMMPGKGMLYEDVLKDSPFDYKIEMHQHQLLLILNRKK
jgi:hypothetical protein